MAAGWAGLLAIACLTAATAPLNPDHHHHHAHRGEAAAPPRVLRADLGKFTRQPGQEVVGAALRASYTASLELCASTCAGAGPCIGFNFDTASSSCGPVTWSQDYVLRAAAAGGQTAFYFKLVEKDTAPVVPRVEYSLVTPVNNVVLQPGFFLDYFLRNVQYLEQFRVDDMLYWFRNRSGIANPPGASYGWDNGGPDRPYGLRGSLAGAFLMGAGGVIRWNATTPLGGRVGEVVANISSLQEDDGYLMAFPRKDCISRENPDYVTSWVTHGMLEAYISGHDIAIKALRRHFDWFNTNDTLPQLLPPKGGADIPGLPFTNRSDPQFTRGHLVYLILQGIIHHTRMALVPGVGTMQDVQTVLQYEERWWLEQLAARNLSAIWMRHYYPHNYEVTALEAYMDMYMITGEDLYINAVDGFWDMFREYWLHVGGSVAIKEWELYPPGSYYLIATGENPKGKDVHSTGELCGNAFWIKLNQRLHRLRPAREAYVAEIERSLLNVVLSNIVPSGAGIRQFAILHKVKMVASNVSTCCEGQGTRILGSLPEYVCSVHRATDSLFVNLFVPAACTNLTSQRYTLAIETLWPRHPSVRMTITGLPELGLGEEAPVFGISVRIPSWVAAASVRVQAGSDTAVGTPASFLNLTRGWRNNDVIAMALPMALRATNYTGLTQIPPYARYAFEVGPVLLAITGPWDDSIGSIRVRNVDPTRPTTWMVPTNTSLVYTVRGNPGLLVKPYYDVQDEFFEVYPVFG